MGRVPGAGVKSFACHLTRSVRLKMGDAIMSYFVKPYRLPLSSSFNTKSCLDNLNFPL
jgi:hypothetical protein